MLICQESYSFYECFYMRVKSDVLIQLSIFQNRPSTSGSFRVTSQPMKILEIPPYRKNQLSQNPTAIVNPSPPRATDIPSMKTKKSNDWQPAPIDNSELQQVQIPAAINSDLVRRLKNSESAVHRSSDCIVAGSKVENVPMNESAMKVAPSWTNVAQRSESISSATGAVQSGGSKKASIDDGTKGKFRFQTFDVFIQTKSFSLAQLLYTRFV